MKAFEVFSGRLGFIVKLVVAVAIIYTLAGIAFSDWGSIASYVCGMNAWLFALSLGMLCVYVSLVAVGWRMILGGMGHRVGLGESVKIRTISDLGRYIPGKFWLVLGRMHWCSRMGIPNTDTFASTIIELSLNLASGMIVFFVFLPWMNMSSGLIIPAAAVLLACLLAAAEPALFARIANAVLKRLGMQELVINISRKRIAATLAYFLATWAFFSVCYFTFLNSIYPVDISGIGVMTAIYAVSFVSGFVVLVAPSGLGVREGVMSLLLAAFMPLPLAAAVALISRVWNTAAELIVAGVAAATSG